MIQVRDLQVRFGETLALALPALDIEVGDRLGVRGPNGSGKSTLLRVLAGLLHPTTGSVTGLLPPGRAVLLHQDPWLFRGSAAANVAYAARHAGRAPGAPAAALERLGIGALASRRARDLSVGERRRVALARALCAAPELLLLDEPFAGLDADGIRLVREALSDFRGTLVVAAPDLGPAPTVREMSLGDQPRNGADA